MGSQWTNKYAILRDLSFAQGRQVPAEIVGSVGYGQKPPSIKIKEETEEEFFQTLGGDGELCTKPDLDLIKEMLNLVKENEPPNEEDTDKIVVISKLNPLSDDFLPKREAQAKNYEASHRVFNEIADFKEEIFTETSHIKEEIRPTKKRKERNAAIISLLEREQSVKAEKHFEEKLSTLINQISSQRESETVNDKQNFEVKLLKPNDFIININKTEAVHKVNNWLHNPAESEQTTARTITLSPINMFKKKMLPNINFESMFKRKSENDSIKSSDSETVPKQADNVFVPSTHANEYYKKFVERRQVQKMTQEDIWKRAERLMKEIDAKRLKEKEDQFAESVEKALEEKVTSEEDNPTSSAITNLPSDIPGE